MRIWFLIASLLFVNNVAAQKFVDGWTLIASSNDGTLFVYDVTSLTKDNSKYPNIISVKIAEDKGDKAEGYKSYKFYCAEKKVQIDGGSQIFIGNEVSVRNALMTGFCGVSKKESMWVLAGATGTRTSGVQYWFVDANSVSKNNTRYKNGSSLKLTTLILNPSGGKYLEFNSPILEGLTSCSESKMFFNNPSGGTELSISKNTALWAIQHQVCNGYLDTADKTFDEEPINQAKKKCTDLGFKSGTEGFGKCVLQLSK